VSTIRVSDEVKERLRDLKRDDESFNDLLDRLSRTEKDVEQIAEDLSGIGSEGFEEDMQDAHDELNESLEERIGR
jgi:predicted CopG family antitoxin